MKRNAVCLHPATRLVRSARKGLALVSALLLFLLAGVTGCAGPHSQPESQSETQSESKPELQTLRYLKSISGKQTLAGQHNKEPNADPDRWTRYIHETTGSVPALWKR